MSKQNNKGLQRFTDFDTLKTVEQFEELKKTDEIQFGELVTWLQDQLNKALKKENPGGSEIDVYFNRIEKILPVAYPKETVEANEDVMVNIKRERWYVNDSRIKDCLNKELTKNGYLPTNTQLSQATGLSRVTIDKHLKENGESIYKTEEVDKLKILNNMAVSRLYKIGMTQNDTKALKMFIDYTGEPKKTVVNNHYIQINNTRIDSLLIDQLPIETRNQIEALIINNRLL